jgi:hypothetical protein
LGASFASGRNLGEFARVGAVGANRHLGGDNLIKEWSQAFNGKAHGTSNQDCAVTECAVLANATKTGWETLGHDELCEQLT